MRSAGNFSPEWGYLAPAPSMLRTVRVVLVATAVGATAGAGAVLSLVDRPAADNERVAVAAHAIVTSAQAAAAQESQAVNGAPVIAPLAAGMKTDARSNVIAVSAPSSPQAAAAMQATAQQPSLAQAPQAQAARAEQSGQGGAAAPTTQASGSEVAPANAAAANEKSAPAHPEQAAVAALSEPPAATATSQPPTVTSDTTAVDQSDQSFVGPQQPQQKRPKHHTATANNRDFLGAALRRLFSARAGGPYFSGRGL